MLRGRDEVLPGCKMVIAVQVMSLGMALNGYAKSFLFLFLSSKRDQGCRGLRLLCRICLTRASSVEFELNGTNVGCMGMFSKADGARYGVG
jgi:hypothetical protein